ncbi:S41 family peptidase [Paenibacillus assamensis]|uniref:S41 family peptidase n=1 Tax=Paenibacillus assamensis TaxID=311244 RepID=UPI00040687FB|nr:S41 family peptidase [Paenibacillus assamensis]
MNLQLRSMRTIVSFFLTFALLTSVFVIVPNQAYANTETVATTSLEVKKEAAGLIEEHYGITFSEEQIKNSTMQELTATLNDPFSRHITAKEWEQMNNWSESEEMAHIGITFAKLQGQYRIVTVTPGSPAEQAGLKQGDAIVSIDGAAVKNQTKQDIFSVLFGKKDTSVKMVVQRGKAKMTKSVKRAVLPMAAVEGQMLDKRTGYIRIYTFMDQMVYEQFEAQWNALRKQGMKSVILDLRYNTGGLMEETRQVASLLRDKGVFTYYKSPAGLVSTSTLNKGKKPDYTMTVLVNEYTASSSEALTGFLQGYKLATVVGTKTYGKGVMQMPYELSDGSYLMLTTQEFFAPDMTKIQQKGLQPNAISNEKKAELNRILVNSGLMNI